MKSLFLVAVFISSLADAQSLTQWKVSEVYSTHPASVANAQIITKFGKHLTTKIVAMTSVESEIHNLEDAECEAMLKRDTATLKIIWARDFTLEDSQSEVVVGANPIPYYVSFGRMIKRIDFIDDMVFTKGYEFARLLKTDGTLADPEVREFFHTWVNKDQKWRLITRINQPSSTTSISID